MERSRRGALRGPPPDRYEGTARLRSVALHGRAALRCRQARPADGALVCRDIARRQDVETQKLVFTETKGGSRIVKMHELPILPPLRQSIDATLTGHWVYLVTAFGKPHSAKAFGNWFKKRCREAGLDEV